MHVLRCFVHWSKYTSSIGLNQGFLFIPTAFNDLNDENNSTSQENKTTRLNSVNQSIVTNMLRTTGTGALSMNAQQQAKYFFDFQFPNSCCVFNL
jgi:hypothetical protein